MENRKKTEPCLILDGGMGTMLQEAGLQPGQPPEILAVEQPELVTAIHRAYLEAGAGVIYTDTFGANEKKLAGCGHSVQQVVAAAVRCAQAAARPFGARVALDIGPLGELMEPVGSLAFEEAYRLFAQQVQAGAQAGADLVVIETMSDLYEVKAAVLAAKENTRLPVWVSMSFEGSGRTFTGCSVEAMALTLQGLGVDAVGINCSLGPVEILPLAQRLCAATSLPVFIKPNAGLPDPASGAYNITPQLFARTMKPYLDLGAFALGGCCGTTPGHILQLARAARARRPAGRAVELQAAVCTPTRVQRTDGLTVVGERINPTGKKRFKQALLAGDMNYILAQALDQQQAGAQLLDINVGVPGVDEPALLEQVVRAVQGVCDLPLLLDSSDPKALARALRVYNGKPVVNSVNGKPQLLAEILPLCKKYGAAVVGLALDKGGIPPTAEGRYAIAQRIVSACDAQGIPRTDIYIDCLTLTVSAQQKEAAETLRAIRMVKQGLGVGAVLGVSNISFGLPRRELLNSGFLQMAAAAGLDLAILNPNNAAMMQAVRAARVLLAQDRDAAEYIAAFAGALPGRPAEGQPPDQPELGQAIRCGRKQQAAAAAAALLREGVGGMQLVEEKLIPALDAVGQDFEEGRLFLPQLLQAAAAAQAAFEEVRRSLAAGSGAVGRGRILLATVKGDIHDIGKNIVRVLLENYGYEVTDLGRDVPPQRIVQTVKEKGIPLVGLSALMTTTLPSMEETIRQLRAEAPGCQIFVGGAVLTPGYAKKLGADYYAKDAKQSADIARRFFAGKGNG